MHFTRRWFGLFCMGTVIVLAVGCGIHLGAGASDVSVASVKDLGTIPTDSDILGRDGGYSAAFQGYSVWLYGDTFLAQPNAEGYTLISDSWSYTSDLDAAAGITGFQQPTDSTGSPTMVLPETPAEQAFNAAHNGNSCQQPPCGERWALWPSSVVVDPESGNALVFYALVLARPGSFNFQAIGNSLATWQSLQQLPQRPTLNPPIVVGHPDLLFTENEPNFGSAALIANGMLYVYGCGLPTSGTDKGCRLGRVAPTNVLDRSSWSFYVGDGRWSSQDSDAVSVFTGDNILSVAWNSYLQKYIAVYSAPFSNDVMMRTATAPEGLWSNEVFVFTAMAPTQENVYDAHAHSEYDQNGGQTIYVSYSRSTGAFTSEMRLVAVTLASAPTN